MTNADESNQLMMVFIRNWLEGAGPTQGWDDPMVSISFEFLELSMHKCLLQSQMSLSTQIIGHIEVLVAQRC